MTWKLYKLKSICSSRVLKIYTSSNQCPVEWKLDDFTKKNTYYMYGWEQRQVNECRWRVIFNIDEPCPRKKAKWDRQYLYRHKHTYTHIFSNTYTVSESQNIIRQNQELDLLMIIKNRFLSLSLFLFLSVVEWFFFCAKWVEWVGGVEFYKIIFSYFFVFDCKYFLYSYKFKGKEVINGLVMKRKKGCLKKNFFCKKNKLIERMDGKGWLMLSDDKFIF